MNNEPFRNVADNGSRFSVELIPPDDAQGRYHVDLVRTSRDKLGLEHRQRLTLGKHRSWGEAEEHQQELEDALSEHGPEMLGEAASKVAQLPYIDGQYLAVVFPLEAADTAKAHLLMLRGDQLSTALIARGSSLKMETVVSRLDTAWAVGGNDHLLDTAQAEIQSHELPKTNLLPQPDYHISLTEGRRNTEVLHAVKTWIEDGDEHSDSLALGEYEIHDNLLASDEALVSAELLASSVEAGMNYAERLALEYGSLDPKRDDPRIFFADDAPPDPFLSLREQELAGLEPILDDIPVTEMDTEPFIPVQLEQNLESVIARRAAAPLLKSGEALNYSFEIMPGQEAGELELFAEKWWLTPEEEVKTQRLTLATYTDDASAYREHAALYLVNQQLGLESAMHKAEILAQGEGYLDPNRDDLRLFTQGPPDPFETMAQRLQGEINPYWNTSGEKIEDTTSNREVENPYWRLDTLPVNDLQGEPLGHALHIVVYPSVPRDQVNRISPAIPEGEPFKMLEMAHFETTEAADKFSKEFKSYLVPGMVDGPELAEAVAHLEGLPTQWKSLEGGDLKAYRNAELTLTCELSDWHPYNPDAEREARLEAEGLYGDPLITFNAKDDSHPEPASLDFDL